MFRGLALAGIAVLLSFSIAQPDEKTVKARPFQRAEYVTETGFDSASTLRFHLAFGSASVAVATELSPRGDLESMTISAWYHRHSGDFAVRVLFAGAHLLLELPGTGSRNPSI